MRRALTRILGRPLESFDAPRPADAIIVLGAALHPGGALSPVAEERVHAGVAAFRAGLAPRLVFTGGRAPFAAHSIAEATAMAAAASALGIPADAILIEDQSRSTWENARCCAALFPDGPRTVWLVTQPFHLRRSKRHFRRAGFTPLGDRIEDSLQTRDPAWGLTRVLREYVSWLKTLLFLR